MWTGNARVARAGQPMRGPLRAARRPGPPLAAPRSLARVNRGPGRYLPPAAPARHGPRRDPQGIAQARSIPAALGEMAALGVLAQVAALAHGAHDAVGCLVV